MDDKDKQIINDESETVIAPTYDDGMGEVTSQDETVEQADREDPDLPVTQEDQLDAEKTLEGAPIEADQTEPESEVLADIIADEAETEAGETADQVEADEQEEGSTSAEEIATQLAGKWYVVHTFAGHENKVATALKQRIEAEHLEHKIFDILVPTQDKIEIRSGKKEQVKEKIFPGYILVNMDLDDNSWLAVRTTPGVTSFVGINNKPTPISDREVAGIVKFMTQGAPATFKDVFMVDDTVKIIDGPFAEFIGKVDSVDKERGRVRVLVSIFGRETPVELDFLQVQKL